MAITQQQIDQLFADHGTIRGGGREDYFGAAYMQKAFRLPLDESLDSIGFGGEDFGVDGFHFDEARRNFYLLQFKWSTSPDLFKQSLQRLISDGMEVIFGKDRQVQRKNDLLLKICSSVYANQDLIQRVFVQFVFNGDPETAERSKVLDRLREELEGKRFLLEQYFGRPVDLAIQFVSAKGLVSEVTTTKLHAYPIRLEGAIEREGPSGEKMVVGFVRLMDLRQMFCEMKQRFFERNIRSSLSDDEAPNLAISRSLKAILSGTESPAVFAFNHNGVTLSAERLEGENGRQRIVEPRMLNGAQTITTFDRFISANKGNARLDSADSPVDELRVLCRIVTEADREFVTAVTVSNNRQNPVRPWNLRANDLIQLELQDWFEKELKIYYERQENAFENLSTDELIQREIQENKAIELLKLAQTYLVSDGEVDKLSKMTEVFESDKLYASVFNEQRLKADAREVMLCYKVQFRLRLLVAEILERGANKYSYLKRGRNMIWALLCQGMLNDPQLSANAERFGVRLSVEADYTDWLKRLVSSRVRFIISRVAAKDPYGAMMEQEKYDFLRTRAFFDRCMDLAHEDYGWVRRRLR